MIPALFVSRFQFKRQLPWLVFATLLGALSVLAYSPPALETQRYVRGEMPELFTVLGFFGDSSLNMLVVSLLFGFLLPLTHSVYAIRQASRLVSKPLEDGRMAMLLSAPHRKMAILHTLWLVLLAGSVLLVLFSFLGQAVTALILFDNINMVSLLPLNLGFLPVSLLCCAIALFLAVTSEDARALKRRSRLVFIVMLVLLMASRLPGWTRQLRYLTFWSFFDGSALALGSIAWLPLILALALALMLVMLSMVFFSKREL